MTKYNFIITSSEEVAKKLKQLGFIKVETENLDVFIFLNNNTLKFSDDIDMSKIRYSNKLFY